MILLTDLYEFEQIRFILTAEVTGLLENVELTVEYQRENLKNAELWVRAQNDNVKGRIRFLDVANKDVTSESFQQDLVSQINGMEDINEYINAWIWRRQQEAKS